MLASGACASPPRTRTSRGRQSRSAPVAFAFPGLPTEEHGPSLHQTLTSFALHRLLLKGRLAGRRETREIDELTAQCESLARQLEEARADADVLKAAKLGNGKKTDKAVQKEIDAMGKQVRQQLPLLCSALLEAGPIFDAVPRDKDTGPCADQVRSLTGSPSRRGA